MTRSEKFYIADLANRNKVYVEFIHTDNYTVLAEIRGDNINGCIRMIRKDEDSWIMLDDDIDRVELFKGSIPYKLQVNIAELYHKYTVGHFTN